MSCLATFKTTSAALMFERTCRSSGISARIAPVPRSLSSSCGLACEFPCDMREKVEEIANSKKIQVAGYHEISE
ncbi:MAG: DUF3343 domain-containing protein [Synergistales bacterium]|nr:DUF3343 domain-containing protein [Synergistales bacterium]MDY6401918.1 DUF3343 domain-containing protein [Synergistales bacterium]MDY6403932.1 DUF3343 domain-containing protein [Synergistales bacterium]MDY6411270.1 DUF3343 domain-containing protein [Synergistales bacterium]MDY6414840.1 DUF3343 domain-containing protein [Synergistales bacterium]